MKIRILFAEDDPLNRMVFGAILKNEPYHITWVVNGLEAIEAWQNNPFHLIILDIQMPGKNGLEVVEFIQRQPGEKPPILALTANKSVSEKRRCMEAGMSSYLSKPVPKETLLTEIQRLTVKETS